MPAGNESIRARSKGARFPGRELLELLGEAVPADHCRQTLAELYIEREVGRAAAGPWRVLDLGCGAGDSVDRFRGRDPAVQWVGLDLPDSPEVRTRTRADARFETFDGVSIPFPESSFDLVYCKQVLEHARRPEPLLAEVRRVLAPGGWFAGSTSQLEPYHSLSIWNYTPVGLAELLRSAGLETIELRPGIDGFTLISRRLVGSAPPAWVRRCFDRWWWQASPVNRAIDAYGRLCGLDVRAVNATKLVFCGVFVFLARRSGAGPAVTNGAEHRHASARAAPMDPVQQ